MDTGQNTFPLHSLFKSSLLLAEAAVEHGYPLHIIYGKVILLQTPKSKQYYFQEQLKQSPCFALWQPFMEFFYVKNLVC